jgi:putative multiple sugar transport system ATP-binding protein
VKLLILDEPTASLNESDSEALLALLREFRAQGISSILISHKLNEILKVADTITVLRDGSTVDRLDCHAEKIDEARIIKSMVGRDLTDRYPERHATIGDTIFEVQDWNVYHAIHADRHLIKDIRLHVKKGEVVGIAGLMGAGRTEFGMSVFGKSYGQKISGRVFMHGKEADVSTVQRAMDNGIAYVTEDRKTYGLVLIDDIKRNISLANLPGVSSKGVIDDSKEILVASKYRRDLNIRCSSVFQQTVNLSGGNQQKVVLSKWLFTGPDVLILDEPTRGIDVGAKYEIYSIINALAESGKAVILISSEMPELLGMSDRIYVMNDGRIVGEMPTKEATQEKIMHTIMKSWED